jgi:small subunit ribosomal protein S12
MATLRQLLRKPRIHTIRRRRRRDLEGSPQKRGVCARVFDKTPRKPNSALRKNARVRLSNRRTVTVFIPGKGHNLQKFSVVLVRGGRTTDVPGSKYKAIRGADERRYSLQPVKNRRSSRSKYGIRKLLKRRVLYIKRQRADAQPPAVIFSSTPIDYRAIANLWN